MMNRRTFTKILGLATVGASAIQCEALAGKFSVQEYAFLPLRGGAGYFTEKGGTIGWFTHQGESVIIDAQFPDTVVNVLAELKKNDQFALKYLINTHHHFDHTAGNIALKGIAEKVLAHENSKKNQMASAEGRGSSDKQLYPTETFSEETSIKVGGETITLSYHGPAHTDGDAVTHLENANIVHMGDLIFNRRFPFIDKSAGASIANWSVVLDKCMAKFDKDTQYIFGHSDNGFPVTGAKADLEAMQNYLNRMFDMVKEKVKIGMPEEEILRIKSVPGAEEWKGDGLQRSLSAALAEIKE